MKNHKLFNIEWIDFPENKKNHFRLSGDYSIGNIHFGTSIHIRERVLNQIRNIKNGRSYSEKLELVGYIQNCIIKQEPIKVYYLKPKLNE